MIKRKRRPGVADDAPVKVTQPPGRVAGQADGPVEIVRTRRVGMADAAPVTVHHGPRPVGSMDPTPVDVLALPTAQRKNPPANTEKKTRFTADLETKDAEEAKKTGAMIAFLPDEEWALKAALPLGEPAKDLHVTVAFLGKAADYDEQDQATVIAAVTKAVSGSGAIEAKAFSVNLFNPKTEDACIVLGIGGDSSLSRIRDSIWHQLDAWEDGNEKIPENHTPWVPHITLAYTPGLTRVPEAVDRTGPVLLTHIGVFFGGDVTRIPLSGE